LEVNSTTGGGQLSQEVHCAHEVDERRKEQKMDSEKEFFAG
jgi:hypothetical protein